MPRMAHQAVYPTLGKTMNKPFDVSFFRVGENHAITGLHMDDEQHVLALDADGMDQPLFGVFNWFIVLDNG